MLFLWKHVHECLRLEESFEFSEKEEMARLVAEERESERRNLVKVLILCLNMFRNVLNLKNHVSHFVVVVETC